MNFGHVFVGRDSREEPMCYLMLNESLKDQHGLIYDRGQLRYGHVGEIGLKQRGLIGRPGLLCAAMRERRSAAQFDLAQFGICNDEEHDLVFASAVQNGYVREVAVPLACTLTFPDEATDIIDNTTLPLLVRAAVLSLLVEDDARALETLNTVRRAMKGLSPTPNDALAAVATYLFMRGKAELTEQDRRNKNYLVREGIYGDLVHSGMLPWATALVGENPVF